jgi:hypothetical protein
VDEVKAPPARLAGRLSGVRDRRAGALGPSRAADADGNPFAASEKRREQQLLEQQRLQKSRTGS